MNDVFIAGVGMTALGRFVDRSVKNLTREAVWRCLEDANAQISDVEAAWFSNSRQGLLEGQNGIRGQCALRPLGLQNIPITNVENACASGSTALSQAYAHIGAGLCETALVVGAEKMFFPDQREAMFKAFLGGTDIEQLESFRDHTQSMAAHLIPPDLPEGGQRSFFMDSYAGQARLHMDHYGTTREQLAEVAVKNRWHATFNHHAQFQKTLTVDQVLAERLISWPFTLPMCAPISDGACAIVICASSALPRLQPDRAVKIRAIELASGSDRDDRDFANHIGRRAALAAYEQAHIDPGDTDLVEVHDATAYSEIQQIENLGLCPLGEGGSFSAAGHTRLGGKIPVNPSGGLISKGHPVGATGLMQLHELTTQLRGEAGKRQVSGARLAVAENGGGFYRNEEAVTAVTVLEKMGATP
ncbi:thiolase family protein [Pseudomaricurvus alkylphenolicus]|uniref:thiolase C-terminal domain-containing protein n=1 Tax=Pseudomaricurvus alkylphenolicus TaxID=1306991 RepID=UPI0014247395|nr:thiolase family protein [Pseudomaricurvus alkylphenolicus]